MSVSTVMPPTSASDLAGQHITMGGITFRAALVCNIVNVDKQQNLLFIFIEM